MIIKCYNSTINTTGELLHSFHKLFELTTERDTSKLINIHSTADILHDKKRKEAEEAKNRTEIETSKRELE